MSFVQYLSRKLAGLPPVESAELIEAKYHSLHKNSLASSSLFLESDYDLRGRPLDLHTYGAISPILQEEDCISSLQLEELAEKSYKQFNL